MTELEFQIPFGSIDPKGAMKFRALLEMFQEIADVDASKFNFSVRQTIERSETWMLRKYRVTADRYPHTSDGSLKIKTYHGPNTKLYSLRSFEFANGAGEALGRARTWWVLFDIERGRPVRLDRSDFTNVGSKFEAKLPEDVRVPKLSRSDLAEDWKVRWEDLDVNDHANHITYFGWVLETVPYEVPEEMLPALVECEYLRPAARGTVTVRTEETECEVGREFLHSVSDRTGAELARFRTVWKERPY